MPPPKWETKFPIRVKLQLKLVTLGTSGICACGIAWPMRYELSVRTYHTHTHTHARARAHAHTHTHTRTRAHTHTHAHTRTHTHTHTHTHIHTHTRTHTHAHARTLYFGFCKTHNCLTSWATELLRSMNTVIAVYQLHFSPSCVKHYQILAFSVILQLYISFTLKYADL
jgi:hypothetical protein